MRRPFKDIEQVLKAASGVVAVVPGLALLARTVHLPPNLQTLLGSLALSFGAAVVIAIYLFRQTLGRTPAKWVALGVLLIGAIGVVGAIFFVTFARTHIIVTGGADGSEDFILVPIKPSFELDGLIAPLNYDWLEGLANSAISGRVRTLMDQEAGGTIWLLTGSLLVAQTLILAALVTGAWKVAEDLGRRGESANLDTNEKTKGP